MNKEKREKSDTNQLAENFELQEDIIRELSTKLYKKETLQKIQMLIGKSDGIKQINRKNRISIEIDKEMKQDLIREKLRMDNKDYIDFQDDENKRSFDFMIGNKSKYQVDKIASSLGYENLTKYVYKKITAPTDIPYELVKKYKKIIYSHQTALYYWDLSDVYPHTLHATVPNNYNPTIKNYNEKISLYRSRSGEIFQEDVLLIATELGNEIPITNLERTIADCMDPKYKIDQDIKVKLLPRYLQHPDKNLRKLKKKALEIGTWSYIQPILEVLINEQ